ncbi:lysosomal integral membrane protein II [Tieghemostelium lacteum]|uniref:Lysosomal integral membrane protein II n=1 Tax=Tieghemostelium lacteum TaxID=361077 RepID=A0A152A5E3_TIELA|nr:lysosomal integral membrane protein II [Tieghemostelium lacteum]|eukprot:KYR01452.1 lysosomal integral membrane protein II [Tieghemostelium lacteum]
MDVRRKRLLISFILGLCLIGGGVAVWYAVDGVVHTQVVSASVTLPQNDKTEVINPWTRFSGNQHDKNNYRLYQYYVYNLTNPVEVTQGAYPEFVELGPYHYNYIYKRIIINVTDDKQVVAFKMWKRYFPITNHTEARNPYTDVIYHFNIAYAAMVQTAGGEIKLGMALGAGTINQIFTTLNKTRFQMTAASAAIPSVFNAIYASLPNDAIRYATWLGPLSGKVIALGNYTIYDYDVSKADVTMLQFNMLMDPTFPLSFRNPNTTTTGFMVWYQALHNATIKAGLKQTVTTSVGISDETFDKIFNWYSNFRMTVAIPKLLSSNPNCVNVNCTRYDMPYLQWGSASGLLKGASIKLFQPTLPGIPEFGIKQNYTISLAATKRLFQPNSTINIVTPKGIGTLFALTANQNSTAIAGASAMTLTLDDCVQLSKYMHYMIKNFTWPTIIALNGGPFTKHTVNEFIFNSQDPILKILYPKNPEKWRSSPLKNITTQEKAMAELPTDLSYTGKNDSKMIHRPLTFHGNSTLAYGVPIKIEGHNSENIGPFYLDDAEDDSPPVTLFSEEYARPLHMFKEHKGKFHKLTYHRYRMSDSDWAVNSTMMIPIDHLMNMTRVMGVPLYMSKPRLKGVNEKYFHRAGLNNLINATEDNDVYGDYEPKTGKAIRGRYSIQVNYYVEPVNGSTTSPLFNYLNNMTSDVIYPLVWSKNDNEATQKQVNVITTSYTVDTVRYVLTIVFIVIGGLMVLLSAALFIIDYFTEKGYMRGDQLVE